MGQPLFQQAFKLKFGFKVFLLTAAGLAGLFLFLYLATSREIEGSYGKAIYTIYDLKIRIFPLIFASFYSIFILVVVTLAIAVISIFFSHKIAGPIFRVEQNMEHIGRGDLTIETRFRGTDQLKALSGELNGLTASLKSIVADTGRYLDEAEEWEERIRSLLDEKDPPVKELKSACDELEKRIGAVKKSASGMKA